MQGGAELNFAAGAVGLRGRKRGSKGDTECCFCVSWAKKLQWGRFEIFVVVVVGGLRGEGKQVAGGDSYAI